MIEYRPEDGELLEQILGKDKEKEEV